MEYYLILCSFQIFEKISKEICVPLFLLTFKPFSFRKSLLKRSSVQRLSLRVLNNLHLDVQSTSSQIGSSLPVFLFRDTQGKWSEDILAKWLTVVLMSLINHSEFTKTRSSLAHIVEPPCWLLHQVYLLPTNMKEELNLNSSNELGSAEFPP